MENTDPDDGYVLVDAIILRHISCGAAGTPHLTAVYHADGHDIEERVKIKLKLAS